MCQNSSTLECCRPESAPIELYILCTVDRYISGPLLTIFGCGPSMSVTPSSLTGSLLPLHLPCFSPVSLHVVHVRPRVLDIFHIWSVQYFQSFNHGTLSPFFFCMTSHAGSINLYTLVDCAAGFDSLCLAGQFHASPVSIPVFTHCTFTHLTLYPSQYLFFFTKI